MMPETCPTCGGMVAVREALNAFGVSGEVSEHERRTVEYRFSAVDGGYESVCSGCEEILRGAVKPPSKDASDEEVVIKA